MSRTVPVSIAFLAASWIVPLLAQDFSRFNFNFGGGVSTPLNPTADFAGLSGNVVVGAGYNISRSSSVMGEFMWSGLSPNNTIHPFPVPFGNVNLYTITANYRYQADRIHESPFGLYLIGGGGWYYRFASIDRDFVPPALVACVPVYTWWGFECTASGFVATQRIASKGRSAIGVNAGPGFTIRLSDSGWKFYVEARYHYAWHQHIVTTLIPVTFGFRFN